MQKLTITQQKGVVNEESHHMLAYDWLWGYSEHCEIFYDNRMLAEFGEEYYFDVLALVLFLCLLFILGLFDGYWGEWDNGIAEKDNWVDEVLGFRVGSHLLFKLIRVTNLL